MKKGILITSAVTIVGLFLITIFIFGFRIISDIVESSNKTNGYIEQSQINASNYIKSKYGIDAEIISTKYDKRSYNYDKCSFVEMKYNETTFYVYITGQEATTDGCDNYQYEDIKESLSRKLVELTGIQHEDLLIHYGSSLHSVKQNIDHLIQEYFDGSNFTEVLSGLNEVFVIYIGQDTADINADEVIEQTGIYYGTLVNFDSKEHYDELTDPYYALDSIDMDLRYVDDYRILTSNNDKYHKCIKVEYDDVIVAVDEECDHLSLEKGTTPPASTWNGRGLVDAVKASDSYAISTDAPHVYIYFPRKNIIFGKFEAKLAVQYVYNSRTDYNSEYQNKTTQDNKYLIFKYHTNECDDIRFVMMV